MMNKKRLFLAAGTIASVGAVIALAVGVTFGLFSATNTSDPSSFTAGTVTLANSATVACTVGPMVPGDSSTGYTPTPAGQTDAQTASCTFDIDYTGNVPAFIAVDEISTGTLYDATATGLQYQIADNNAGSYATGGVLNGGNNLYVSTDPAGTTHHTFTVNYALPLNAGNAYQALSSTLTLRVHAVQKGNNGSATGCTAGAICGGITAWS